MTTPQAPIHSGFNAKSTSRDVLKGVRLDGKIAIVTGGYAGCGLETTRALSEAGATVIVPARSLDKARENLRGIAHVEIESLDLASPESIDAFSEVFLASGRPLNMLVNNAGIMAVPLSRDSRGFEAQLATNHLGHFQLTARLWPALAAAKNARVVSLSSRGHVRSPMSFEDPSFVERPYDKWTAYGQSKSANVLFAVALDKRGQAHGVRAFAVHPGAVMTELVRHMPEEELAAIRPPNWRDLYKTPEQGGATAAWCAASPQLEGMGGVYCEDCDIAVPLPADNKETRGVRPWAIDPAAAGLLWTKSEEWTGVPFRV